MNLGAHSPVFIVLLPLSASLLCLALCLGSAAFSLGSFCKLGCFTS